jgi:hypothetical protein
MCTADLAPDDDMAYDAQALTDLVHRRLKAVPLTSLASIADAAGVDRHTVARALMVVEGRTFRQIQLELGGGGPVPDHRRPIGFGRLVPGLAARVRFPARGPLGIIATSRRSTSTIFRTESAGASCDAADRGVGEHGPPAGSLASARAVLPSLERDAESSHAERPEIPAC